MSLGWSNRPGGFGDAVLCNRGMHENHLVGLLKHYVWLYPQSNHGLVVCAEQLSFFWQAHIDGTRLTLLCKAEHQMIFKDFPSNKSILLIKKSRAGFPSSCL
jgi:hypothetical protein